MTCIPVVVHTVQAWGLSGGLHACTVRYSVLCRLITKYMNFHDSFSDDPMDTCDLKSNIFTKSCMTPKRIDFIFYSNELSPHLRLSVVSKKLALSGMIPGQSIPYSDHEGLEGTFKLEQVFEGVDGAQNDEAFSSK